MKTQTKRKLAFIDHSFHKMTRSSEFFQKILCREYVITVFFDEGWQGGPEINPNEINAGNFDVVLFWQAPPSAPNILRLSCENIIWIPMYDNEQQRSCLGWRALRRLGLKVICFSKTLYETTQRFGINSLYVQYFPKPCKQAVTYGMPRVFLWQRVNEIGWPLVKRLLAGNKVEKIVLKADPDPSHIFDEPGNKDVREFNIEVERDLKIADGASNDDYLRLLSSCNVFIAPRLSEGIGLSFLEAMALGMCVVGPNRPTMNEYVSSGNTGFLFDPERRDPIDLADFAGCGSRARARAASGWTEWQASLPVILHFIAEPTCKRRSLGSTVPFLLLWGFDRVVRKAKMLIRRWGW